MNTVPSTSTTDATISDGAAVRDVVTSAYCNGAYNALDTVAMARGFHPGFAIISPGTDQLERYTIAEWIAAIEKRKSAPGFDIATAKRQCYLSSVDVTGDVANVKMEVRKDGVMIYTDYLFLLRFADGWKIVSKIYQDHQ
ncbi:MAG TPA: nuclear transport factor 2 family protein [Xanthomonadaceae bacterium]|nr:nuclear transport factor 2 family protein [Xanthomonadaceae bacterium]